MSKAISVSEAIEIFKQNLILLTGDGDPIESITLVDKAMSKLRDEVALNCKYISRETFDYSKQLSIEDVMIYESKRPPTKGD